VLCAGQTTLGNLREFFLLLLVKKELTIETSSRL